MYLFSFRRANYKHLPYLLYKNKNFMMEQENTAKFISKHYFRQTKKMDRNYDLTLSINGSHEVEAVVRIGFVQANRKGIYIDQYTSPSPTFVLMLSEIEGFLEPAVDVLVLAYRGSNYQLRFPSQNAKTQFMESISAEDDSGMSSCGSSSNSNSDE